MRYAENAEAVFSLKDHLAFCPKGRRPLLQNSVGVRLRDLFVEAGPTGCVAELFNRLQALRVVIESQKGK